MSESIFFKRHSGRSFQSKEVPQDILDQLAEIIRWSPSCSNNQPWRLVIARKGETRGRFNEALARGNEWAAKAPVMVALCAKREDDYTRDDDPVYYYQFDSGMACLSLLLGAVELGLMGHAMAGYDAVKVKAALDVPEEYHVLCVIALGYEGSLDDLDEATRKKDESPRVRKEVTKIISYDRFNL